MRRQKLSQRTALTLPPPKMRLFYRKKDLWSRLREHGSRSRPPKADGSVDQKALWNRSPEAWAEWNDGKRKDGGANSEAYLGSVLKQVEGEGRALAKAYAKETDFDRRDELEGKMLANTDRSQKIRTLIQG